MSIKTTSSYTYKQYTWANGSVSVKENMSSLLAEFLKKPEELKPVVKKHAFNIAAIASRDAPVKTGTLKNTLAAGVEFVDDSHATVSDATNYGVFQELGTSRVTAKHFLGGAAEREAEPFFDEIRKVLTE